MPQHPMSKPMSVGEFVGKGYLQEANRRFFHPLGLSMHVAIDESGDSGHIWIEKTDDLEGFAFFLPIDRGKVEFVDGEMERRRPHREETFGGSMIEPICGMLAQEEHDE